MAENVTRINFIDMNRAIDQIMDRTDKKFKVKAGKIGSDVLKNMFGSIIEDTPVNDADPADMGTTKANWQVTQGTPANGVLHSKQPNRSRRNIKIPTSFKQVFGKVWFLANNVSWISILEFGGYPNPPKQGTWNKRSKRFEIRSSGGFSLQAPHGMYRKNVAMFKRFVTASTAKFAK